MSTIRSACLFFTSIFVTLSCWSQKSYSAGDVADSVQTLRNDARKLWRKDHPTKDELDNSIKILNSVFPYLNSLSAMKDLAQGNFYLYFRKSDTYFDLVNAYTRNKQYTQAIAAFEKMYEENSSFYSQIEKDSVFEVLRKEPEFKPILDKFKTRAAVWRGSAFKTPLQPDLSEDEKVAGLSQLWAQAKYNFVYLEGLTTDWNKTYLDYIPRVRTTKSTTEYYKVLQQFYALLHDGHSNVYPPAALYKVFYSRPPMRTELLEGRVFITAVSSASLVKSGIVPGLEIIAIDGEQVIDYAEKYIKPYQSSSTPQDLDIRTFSYSLLSGDSSIPLQLTLKDTKGKVWTTPVNRSGYTDIKSVPSLEYKNINAIGYLTINNFEDEKIIAQYDSLFPEIAKTKGLIIDIRNNGGGDSYIGYHILTTLTNQPFKTSSSSILRYDSRFARTSWYEDGAGGYQPNEKLFYDKPVAVLVSARTFSAAEDFAVAFDYMKRGKLIGQATGGSTGQPLQFSLPGGGWARVCAKKDTYPDGKIFVGVGVLPHIVVEKKIKGMLKGEDAVLNKALEWQAGL